LLHFKTSNETLHLYYTKQVTPTGAMFYARAPSEPANKNFLFNTRLNIIIHSMPRSQNLSHYFRFPYWEYPLKECRLLYTFRCHQQSFYLTNLSWTEKFETVSQMQGARGRARTAKSVTMPKLRFCYYTLVMVL